jgi:predicted nuclease of restriction endonuclease-like (RecB) superfamily
LAFLRGGGSGSLPGMAKKRAILRPDDPGYSGLLGRVSGLLDQARRATVRAANSFLTATYWEVGRQIVEFEQGGAARAGYGEAVLKRLAADLTAAHGRGFSERNLENMRGLYLGWDVVQTSSGRPAARVRVTSGSKGENPKISQTPSAELTTASDENPLGAVSDGPGTLFPLPWSHYVRLMSVPTGHARAFYEDEAILAGWSVRQLDRMIATQHYERTALSKNKAAMIRKGREPIPGDAVSVEETIRDPYVLEFLDLKDEYSETDLEDAIITHLQAFLLEMGKGFAFVARQHFFRLDGQSFRMDLILFHRRLRCLFVIDLKLGKFTHEDAGQMNLYLNYAREHLTMPGEGNPVGLILCSERSDTVVRYAMGGINAKVFASRYLTVLPDAETVRREIERTKRAIERRQAGS